MLFFVLDRNYNKEIIAICYFGIESSPKHIFVVFHFYSNDHLYFHHSILGILLEGGDMVYHEAYKSESHWDHLRILTLLTFVGFVDLLHLRMVLKESFWATITPMAFAFIGYMFNQHGQETQARTVAHNINAYILYAAAMSRFIEILIGKNPSTHLPISSISPLIT